MSAVHNETAAINLAFHHPVSGCKITRVIGHTSARKIYRPTSGVPGGRRRRRAQAEDRGLAAESMAGPAGAAAPSPAGFAFVCRMWGAG